MNAEALLTGIRDGDAHRGGIRCLRLLRVETRRLQALRADVERLCSEQRPSEVARPEHITHWTRPFGEVLQYSLLNATGRCDDFSADHDISCHGKRFHHRDSYPVLADFVEALPHVVNFRVNILGPHAGLSPHEENALIRTRAGTVGVRARFHLPIVTDPRAELVLDGHVFHLAAGTIHFVNHGCMHAATNHGDRSRIHLAWDMLLTREAFAYMFDDGPPPSAGLIRVRANERAPSPIRTERVGAYRKLPPMVTPEEAAAGIILCEAQ